jgi:hypothetical protein
MIAPHRSSLGVLLAALNLVFALSVAAQPQSGADQASAARPLATASTTSASRIEATTNPDWVAEKKEISVDWSQLAGQSLLFMGVENAFRYTTEDGTRETVSGPFTQGYWKAVENLHGWSDGDPFYVNYVGHPMQGAVSGYLWTHNDRAYRNIQFGQNRRYWKGKLRGAAYSYIYSVLIEIGPLSEASIGAIQAKYPAQGFVDHVVTPAIGLAWSIGEDALDRYAIRHIEAHTRNRWALLLVRSGLNPARSMANVLAFQPPWHRDNRPGVLSPYLQDRDVMEALGERNTANIEVAPPPGVAPFEFTLASNVRAYMGAGHNGSCVGGGSSAALRLAAQWQVLVDVSGCKLLGLSKNLSGDSLSYQGGIRWTPEPSTRWRPHLELLGGGTKLTQEFVDPELKVLLEQAGDPDPPHSSYSKHWETNGFAMQAGGGVDVKLNSALSFRVAELQYFHSWAGQLNGINYGNGLSLSGGLVLRMGTW